MLPGLWQIFYSLGIFASCRLLPRPTFWVAVFYLGTGLAVLAWRTARRRFLPGRWACPSERASCWPPPCFTAPWSAIMSQSKARAVESTGRFAYDGLERVFHEKARLGIMTSLVSQPRGVVFSDLKEMCHLTDGNLSRHLQVLHEAGLVEIWKGYHKNRPQTLCRITDEGRRRFFEYINVLETVVHDAMNAARTGTNPAPSASTSPRAGPPPERVTLLQDRYRFVPMTGRVVAATFRNSSIGQPNGNGWVDEPASSWPFARRAGSNGMRDRPGPTQAQESR